MARQSSSSSGAKPLGLAFTTTRPFSLIPATAGSLLGDFLASEGLMFY
jgi:hypothetical protein